MFFPPSHSLIQRHAAKWPVIARVGRSACDQCRFCTEFCPRYLLGHPIQPHRAMQSLGFSPSPAEIVAGTLYCCECNLCSLYACPEDLDPKNVCVQSKPAARANGLFFTGTPESVTPHPDGGLPPRAHDPPDLAAGALRVPQRRPAHRAQILAQPRDVCR